MLNSHDSDSVCHFIVSVVFSVSVSVRRYCYCVLLLLLFGIGYMIYAI